MVMVNYFHIFRGRMIDVVKVICLKNLKFFTKRGA